MKSLSSIIKGERIRNQSIINFSERLSAIHIEYEEDDTKVVNTALTKGAAFEGSDTLEEDTAVEEGSEQILKEAQIAAARILEEANQEAQTIVSKALEIERQIKENAEVTKAKLLSEASAQRDSILEEAAQAAMQIKESAYIEKQKLIKSTEGEMVETLMTLLDYLISEEVFNNTQWVTYIVKRMLDQEVAKQEVKVILSPKLYERLTEADKEQIMGLKEVATFEVAESLNDTTCKVDIGQGSISYDVEEGLKKVFSDMRVLKKIAQETV